VICYNAFLVRGNLNYQVGRDMTRKLKICPKYGGKMMPDRDEYGAYEQCIQCGYLMDLKVSATQDDNMFNKVMAKQ
jgi:hypothetical protein